jgi:hypothetical protein
VGPLSDERVVKVISKWCVPVAINLYKIRGAQGEAGDFFRAVHKEKPQYQGFWIVSPEGKVIASHHEVKSEKTWPQEVLQVLQSGLDKELDREPRQYDWKPANPYRGHAVMEDGSVNLALFVRFVFSGKPSGPGAFDSIPFSATDWAKFAPAAEAKVGTKWDIPDELAKQFCKCLSAKSDQTNVPRPHEVNEIEMHGVVQSIQDDIATLAYHGKIAAVHQHPFAKEPKTNRGQASFMGFARYNLKTREMQTFTLAFDGTYHAFPPHHERQYTIFAGVEWQREPAKLAVEKGK